MNTTGLRDQLEQESLEVIQAFLRDDNPNLRMHAAQSFLQLLATERARKIEMGGSVEMRELVPEHD